MKIVALLALIGLALVIIGCGTNTTASVTSPSTPWEATLTGGTGEASLLNFVTSFSVNPDQTLTVTEMVFLNAGSCFVATQTPSATATLTTNASNVVTGPFTFTVKSSPPGNTLALSGNLTGRSNGTTTTIGTLSNGVITGTWTLTGSSSCTNTSSGTATGTFLMCQGAATCSSPT